MKIVIVEDEPRSARRLARMICDLRPEANICETLGDIASATDWFSANPPPDLVFLDIELGDGDAFDLLDNVDIAAPIIFCTAFSKYALKAFRANSIDYLLKPLEHDALAASLEKYDRLSCLGVPAEAWRHLRGTSGKTPYRKRFLVRGHKKFNVVPVSDIIAVDAWMKVSRLYLHTGKNMMFDETLKQVGETLDPALFFQVSRRVIVRIEAIERLEKVDGGSVVKLQDCGFSFGVSRARARSLEETLNKH